MSNIAKKYQNIKSIEFSGSKILFDDALDFSIGDPDLTTDRKIIEYAFEQAKQGQTHYGNPSGLLELKKEIITYHKKKYNQDISLEQIQITNSASHAMYLVLNALLNPGDEVITFAPLFPNYLEQISLNGGIPVIVETNYEDNFQINYESLESKITSKTKALILNNPCNPTGVLFNQASFEAIYKVCKKHNILIIADDIYTIFNYSENKFTPISTYKDIKNHVIQIRSFSKDFLMTGWRLGYIIADKSIIQVTNYVNENIIYSPNIISQQAAIYALKNYEEIQKNILDIYQKRIETVYQLINDSKYFSCLKPEGTFYVFMNIEKTGLNSDQFAKYVYEKAHIKVFSGTLFGGNKYNKFVRLAINISLDNIKEAFQIMESLDYKFEN